MNRIQLVEGWKPGSIGFLIGEHGRYYARDWGFDAQFETKIAAGLGDFMARYTPTRDRLFLALDHETILGGLVIDGHYPLHPYITNPESVRLRWFILSDGARGRGVGAMLMRAAMAHVDALGVTCMLGTFAGLDAARHLYEQHGFMLTSELDGASWGVRVREQEFQRQARPSISNAENE